MTIPSGLTFVVVQPCVVQLFEVIFQETHTSELGSMNFKGINSINTYRGQLSQMFDRTG